ncbi:hypothetical protein SAMN02927916_1272 [Flavobacterium anhuiense]|uniref:Lipoprotein n=1 Tax=Flavobacterium anhuiense TaxID=459526 RepID=A0ABY0LGG5_9FLAO|nr:hypothetical protein [Flavobacterium anhuiense]SCY14828.1 hypothetical protein SAMN02927916_1272 [Flavobacterium anhuiense]
MKNIFRLSFVLLFISCTTIKTNNTVIPYLVDIGAEKSIYNEISKNRDRDVVFYVEHLSDSTIKFHLISSNGNDFLRTDRKLFVNDKLYPIIFDTDYLFYSEMKDGKPIISMEVTKNSYEEIPIPSIEEREKNPELYGFKKKSIMIDNSIYWILDQKGKLLKTNTGK